MTNRPAHARARAGGSHSGEDANLIACDQISSLLSKVELKAEGNYCSLALQEDRDDENN